MAYESGIKIRVTKKTYQEKKNLPPEKRRIYIYENRRIFGFSIDDAIELIGAEAACRLIKFYGGCKVYIPNIISIKRKITYALIRAEYKRLISEGSTKDAATKYLADKFKYTQSNIKRISHLYFDHPNTDKEKAKRTSEIDDSKILELVNLYYDLFKKFNMI